MLTGAPSDTSIVTTHIICLSACPEGPREIRGILGRVAIFGMHCFQRR